MCLTTPSLLQSRPRGHGSQAAPRPSEEPKVPIVQGIGLTVPLGQKEPLGHSVPVILSVGRATTADL